MAEKPQDPPSLRDFDYFDEEDNASLADVEQFFVEDDPTSLDQQLKSYRSQRRRQLTQFILSAAFFGAAIWIVSGYTDLIRYVFSDSRPPTDVGNIVDVPRGGLVHNDYVRLEGVTMHRGLVQTIVRTVGFSKEELHYFELSGAGGVFVEVPPELGVEFASFVEVAGRVVDPKRTSFYNPLLAKYEERYYQERRPHERIVQVGVVPGKGRWPFIWLFG
ncbi:MAG: hypothetical protein AAFX94_05235, partial [Myxococcota bacterium]